MRRRFCLLIGMVLAIGAGAAPAQDPPVPPSPSTTSPATPSSKADGEKPLELPRDPAADAPTPDPAKPAELPDDFAKAPSDLSPPPPNAGPKPAGPAGASDTPAKPKPKLPLPFSNLWGKKTASATKTQSKDPAVAQTKADPAADDAAAPAPAAEPAPAKAPPGEPPPLPVPVDPGPPAAVPAAVPAPASIPKASAASPTKDAAIEPSQAVGTQPAGGRPLPLQPPAGAPAATPAAPPAAAAAVPTPSPVVPDPVPAAAPGGPPREARPFIVLSPEELPFGKQAVGLTVDVVAPAVLNINQTAVFKIVVKNSGQTDARGVEVRDRLPEGLTLVSSQPEPEKADDRLVWPLGTVPAGGDRTISLTVKPVKTGEYHHAATVTMVAGGKSRTIVREPKLKVEQTVGSRNVLINQRVQFKIAVSNPGDGPARNVLVQAKLSAGLKHATVDPSEQNLLEQTIDLINPGERVVLDPLEVDAKQGGEQTCVVAVSSPDVIADTPESKSQQAVTVVEPKLSLKLTGPDKRYTDTLATYEFTLENPGTATAQGIKAQATIPVAGRLHAVPPGARYDSEHHRLSWTRAQLQPGDKAVFTFQVRVGGIGLYPIAAEAHADGALLAKDVFQTDVTGLADVAFNVSEGRRVVDVNDETTYTIKVVNSGTKEATNLAISAVLSPNLEPVETSGTEVAAQHHPTDIHRITFPLIERLGPNKSIELGIKVKVTSAEPKIATCRVFLIHEDLTEKLDDVAFFKIQPSRRQ